MRTLLVMAGGLALMFSVLLVGRALDSMRAAAGAFVAVWLVLALVNAWVGVVRYGFSWATELPVLLVVFAIPATAAIVATRMMMRPTAVAE